MRTRWPRTKSWWWLLVAVGAVLILVRVVLASFDSGWAFGVHQSESVRAGSFKPYAGLHIGGEKVATFLASRVTILLAGDEIPTNGLDLRVPQHGFSEGCAVAIDHRGYYLTAAHCTSYKTIYLLFFEAPDKPKAWLARVVWRGDVSKGQPDLAILRVPSPLYFTFDVADDVKRDEPVMAVGLCGVTSLTNYSIQGLQFMGGHVKDCTRLALAAADLRVATDVPIQPGDSGGALVNTHGRLVGINTLVVTRLLWSRSNFAIRPNAKWLSDIIEHDAATHAHSAGRP